MRKNKWKMNFEGKNQKMTKKEKKNSSFKYSNEKLSK